MAAGKKAAGKQTPLIGFGVAAVAVVAAAINLRAGIASIAPVIDQLADALGVSASTAGILTALPGFFFALMGWGAVPLARRVGITPTLFIGGVLIVVGLGLRPFVGGFPLFLVLTAAVVAGIALGNVLLPAWIKEYASAKQAAPLMSVYTAMLGLSGTIAPISAIVFSGENAWRWAVGVWVIPAIFQLVVWFGVLAKTGMDTPRVEETESVSPALATDAGAAIDADAAAGAQNSDQGSAARDPHRRKADDRAQRRAALRTPLWKSPTAVAMLFFFGVQSSMGYTEMGWLPQMLTDQGVGQNTASVALVVLGAFNVAGGVFMPWAASHMKNLLILPIVLGVLTFLGWLGVYVAPAAAPVVWGTLLGLGGMCFPLAIALLAQRTRSPLVTARLSGFVQPGGYVIAGFVPLIVGWLYGVTGGWATALWMLMILSAGLLLFGIRATRNVYIEDELARS